jgi:hypothetical protein
LVNHREQGQCDRLVPMLASQTIATLLLKWIRMIVADR